MPHVPLVELAEQRRGVSTVVKTITAGTARAVLKAAKAKWGAAGELDLPSAYNPQASRRNAITVMVDRMRQVGDGRAIASTLARKVLAEVGIDEPRVGHPVNSGTARRVFTPR